MKCPLCQSESRFRFEKDEYWILDCVFCKHRFVDIEPKSDHVKNVYDDTYFNGGMDGYSDYSLEETLLRTRGGEYARKIEKFTDKKGILLDVGAAAGYILQGFIDEGWQGVGLEPNKSIAKFGQDNFNLDIRVGVLENFKDNKRYNLISMIQVIGHLHNPYSAILNTTKLLKDEGLLLIETWNYKSISAKLFGKRWHEYSPPSVLHFFCPTTLDNFLEQFGFEKIKQGRSLKKISGQHAKSLLRHKIGDKFFLKGIPEKINLIYPSEDLFWALYKLRKNDIK